MTDRSVPVREWRQIKFLFSAVVQPWDFIETKAEDIIRSVVTPETRLSEGLQTVLQQGKLSHPQLRV